MRIGLGVAAAGLVAGGVFWAVGGKTEEPAKPPVVAEKKSKFDIPVWHPDARWKPGAEAYIGSGASGVLGGNAREAMARGTGLTDGRWSYGENAGPFGPISYDPATNRIHQVGGASRGMLDGPLSRARFGGISYSRRSRVAVSADGRYAFFTEPYFDRALRRLDLAKQEVKTLPPLPGKAFINGMAVDGQGRLLARLAYSDKLLFLDVQGKVERELKLDVQGKVDDFTFPPRLNLDEVHGRLYASGGRGQWYIWYWDLKDGSFHGVLPIPPKGEGRPDAGNMHPSAGPFKGTILYNEMSTWFGPDDPEKNFLYVLPVDTSTFLRLDLSKQEVWAFSWEKDFARFIGSGKPRYGGAATLNSHGDVVSGRAPWEDGPRIVRFPRVK